LKSGEIVKIKNNTSKATMILCIACSLHIISILLSAVIILQQPEVIVTKEIIEKKVIVYQNRIIDKQQTKNIKIPYKDINFSAKPYMDISKITCKTSVQWNFLTQQDCIYTYINTKGDERMGVKGNDGFIIIDGYYGVAMGTYFGTIGTKYNITLDSGKTIKVIKVENKDNKDTCENQFMSYANDIIEFVIDKRDKFMQDNLVMCSNDKKYIFSGNFNNYENFKGDIVKIEEVIE
jgi:hypothetical protein